jgi:alcohol dehydrogenase (cytochrome c)
MVPKPGEPGSETWPADGEAWQRGGANCWLTGTFDPETNLLYVGTGNPAPDFDGEVREGDNLYTDSVVAVDVDAGQIRWHYQCTPHDVWDYDSIAECILFEKDGRKLLGHFDKNGYFFVLDRTNGERVSITPFVDRITWGAITRDGQVTAKVYPEKEGDRSTSTRVRPAPRNGPRGLQPEDGALLRAGPGHGQRPPGAPGVQGEHPVLGRGRSGGHRGHGGVHQRVRRQRRREVALAQRSPMCASVLATGGDWCSPGRPSGEFVALDARTGEQLWKFQCGSGHHSSPTTYMVDGRQYIAVPVGWGDGPRGSCPACSARARERADRLSPLPSTRQPAES